MQAIVRRVGVCRSKNIPGMAAMFQRVTVKLSTKYRIWPCLMVNGDRSFLEIDPSEWRDKWEVVQEYATKDHGGPS